jgi:hypothetical protein
MFQLLKGHCQGVRAVQNTCTYMHTYSTSVHILCEAIYDNTGVRDINFMLSKVQMFEVYTYSYSFAKSITVSMVFLLDMHVFKYLGARNCVGTRFSARGHTGPGFYSASCTVGTAFPFRGKVAKARFSCPVLELNCWSLGSMVSITGCMVQGFESQWGEKIFLYSKMTRLGLGPPSPLVRFCTQIKSASP